MGNYFEIEPNNIIHECSIEETASYRLNWEKVFCKDKQGANTKAYLWHIFSFEKYPAISGLEATNEYIKHVSPEYVVLSNEDELAVISNARPENCSLRDYYIFPKNMAWTMAFTHEDGWLGPYFAKHLNYKELNAQNETKLQALEKKKQEIAHAKSKGWL